MSQAIPASVEIGDSVIFQNVQDELVVLNMDTQEYFSLDPVGAKMWQLLMDRHNIDEVADELFRTYEAERPTLRKDLEALVGELMKAGLLKPATA